MKKETKITLIKISIILVIIAGIFCAIYFPLKNSGVLSKLESIEDIKDIILSGGIYSYLIFFIIQFLQTTFVPIPSMIVTLAGVLVFGPWITFGISFFAVMLGSFVSFVLGKTLGKKVLIWITSEKTFNKWSDILVRGKYVFFLMMLFPIFPDDILCFVAGTTNMTYTFYIITNLITRAIGILATCFVGSGLLIPFSGWGIPVWIAIVVVGATLFFVCYKYQPQIEKFILKLAGKKENKQHTNQNKVENENQNQNENLNKETNINDNKNEKINN